MVAIEDARGITLTGGDWPGVIKQLPQFLNRIAHISAQHVLAKKLVEHLPDWRFQKRHSTGMAGAVPGIRAICCVMR